MSTGRFVATGRTRSCPHCKATILESATVCPGCHHHLRFDSAAGQRGQAETPLRVDGILRHSADGGAWEYSIVLRVRNGRGEEISRQVVGVGALQPSEERTFSLAVEVFKPAEVSKPEEASKPAEPPRREAAAAAPAASPATAAARSPAAASSPATAATPPSATAAAQSGIPAGSASSGPATVPSPAAVAPAPGALRPSDPRAPTPGRMTPPGFGRGPARPQLGPARGTTLNDPRLTASDPSQQPKRS